MPGIEPGTSHMRSARSTTELHPPAEGRFSAVGINATSLAPVKFVRSRVYFGECLRHDSTLSPKPCRWCGGPRAASGLGREAQLASRPAALRAPREGGTGALAAARVPPWVCGAGGDERAPRGPSAALPRARARTPAVAPARRAPRAREDLLLKQSGGHLLRVPAHLTDLPVRPSALQ